MYATLALIFVSSLIVGYSGALMPGPLLTITVSESARRGFRAGPLLVAGHAIAEVLLLVGLAFGLSRILEFGVVKSVIAVAGGLVLLWMGYAIVRGVLGRQLSLKLATAGDAASTNHYILTGALISVSNPYWILWWATVGASYVVAALAAGPFGLLAFYFGHILSDLSWYSLVAALVSRGGRLLSDKAYRATLGLCGSFLLVLGAYFVFSGFTSTLR